MSPELKLLLWVAGSFGIGLATVAYVHHSSGGWRRQALVESESGGLIIEVALFLYHIGLPFLALIGGALSFKMLTPEEITAILPHALSGVDLLGLGTIGVEGTPALAGFLPLEWMRGGMAAGLTTGFVLVVLWLAGRTADPSPPAGEGEISLAATMRYAAYAEVHWAFYRAPFALLLDDALWGAAAGFALVAVEWLLLRRLQGLPLREGRTHTLVVTCCALTSGLLYVIARNLWLMIAAHIAIRWFGTHLLLRAAPSATAQA